MPGLGRIGDLLANVHLNRKWAHLSKISASSSWLLFYGCLNSLKSDGNGQIAFTNWNYGSISRCQYNHVTYYPIISMRFISYLSLVRLSKLPSRHGYTRNVQVPAIASYRRLDRCGGLLYIHQ